MAVHPLHFMGQQDGPSSPEELARQRPILGRGDKPQELVEMAAHRRLYVRRPGGEAAPAASVTQVEDAVPEAAEVAAGVWRIDLPAEVPGPPGIPGRSAVRSAPEELLAAIDPEADFRGHRPAWVDQLSIPRTLPAQAPPSLRRLDGHSTVRPENVFRPENRSEFMDASFPWGNIGRVENSDGRSGTGTLIGPRLMVTCGHMVPWAASSWSMRFVPAYYNGQSLHGAGVESYVSDVQGFDVSGSVTGYDWAVCRLYEPLGDWLGYLGYNGWSDSWLDQGVWTNVGYPADLTGAERPTFQTGISVFDTDSDSNGGLELEHRGDTFKGNSGGPFFGMWGSDARLVGVHSGYEEDALLIPPFSEAGNVAASGSGFTNLLAWARTTWP